MEMLYGYGDGKIKAIGSLSADDTLGDIAQICHLTVGELSDILVEIINKDLKDSGEDIESLPREPEERITGNPDFLNG